MNNTDMFTFRRHDWYDAKARVPKFGIQGKPRDPFAGWMHCCEGGKPLIFDTEQERDAKLKELRRANRPLTHCDSTK